MSKSVLSVSVCIALLAASAAVSSAYAANNKTAESSAISATNLAYAALVDGRNEAAIKNYSTAIESRKLPTDNLARSLLNRALAFQNSGDYKNAVNDYTAAMRLDALSPKIRAVALYNRGLAQQKAGAPAMAIEDFTGALLLDPQFSQSYYSRANVLRNHGQYLLAIADYKKARHFKHSQPHLTYFGEALTYEALNQKTLAKSLLLKAVAAKPGFVAARRKLADLGNAAPLPTIAATTPRRPVQIAMLNTSTTTDALITGSISPSKADLTIRKTSLPKPVAVPKSISPAPTMAKVTPVLKMPPLPAVANLEAKKSAPQAITRTSVTQSPVTQAPVTKVKVAVKNLVKAGQKQPNVSGWTVQLTSQRNSAAAWDVWKNLSTRHTTLLRHQQAAVIKATIGTRGVFYRLRVHQLDSKKQAASLCKKLKRKGTGCFVTKA